MSLAVTYCRAQVGIKAPLVTVETHLTNGMPRFTIVGLPETAVKESKERVRSALMNAGFIFPTRRVTVNLAPADLPKEGGRFDLAIALGILVASKQLPAGALENYECAGELALSGEIRAVTGILPMALACCKGTCLLVPSQNATEAAWVDSVKVLAVRHITEVVAHLIGKSPLTYYQGIIKPALQHELDMADIYGQFSAKRALEIAAAGGHNLLLMGPPGTGKTMLASRLPSILPPLTHQESLEVAAIRSITEADNLKIEQWLNRPFRSPHHTASSVALVGGGSSPRPGEISLAHHGVLFLDELPEFERRVLETLREPLESGKVTISRAARYAEFPAKFQLICAMNPCPCGYLGSVSKTCRCTPDQILRYRARISGPLLDRIDMHIEVSSLPKEALISSSLLQNESSTIIRQRVSLCHQRQLQRTGRSNAHLSNSEIETFCKLRETDKKTIYQAIEQLNLSVRAYHRILKVARTIADLAEEKDILTPHLTEALSFRPRDYQVV